MPKFCSCVVFSIILYFMSIFQATQSTACVIPQKYLISPYVRMIMVPCLRLNPSVLLLGFTVCVSLHTTEHSITYLNFDYVVGMSYNLRVSLPTFRKHIFNVLERNGITFDVFASIALQENSSKNIKRKSSFECDEYEMRLMRPCAVTITPMVNILKAITKQMSLDDERQEIYVFTRRNLLTMMLTYARVHGVQYNAILALQPHNAVTADFDLPILLRSHTFSLLDLYVPSVYDSNDRAAFGSRDIMEVYLGCRSELDEQYLNILDGDCNNDTSQYQVIKSEMNIVGIKPQKGLPSFDAIPSPAPLSKRLCAKLNNRRGEPLARIAIGFYGLSRNLRLTLPSFKKHVFDVFDRHDIAYDVFWSAVTAPILVSNRSNEWHIEVDEYDVRLMRPCIASLIPMYQVLNETEFNFSHISPHYHYRDGFSSVRNIFCSLHTQKILDRTIRSYSAANNLVYDAVVTLRPDTAVVRDIDLASMLVKKKFSKKHIYLPNFAHFKGVNDRSAYGSPAVMSTYLNRDLAFKISLSTNTNKWIYNTETFLKNYLKEMNIPVIKSTVRVIRVRADGRVPAYDSNEVVM